MAGGESCSDDSRTNGSEQEEPQEPVLKKQIIERRVGVAVAASSNGNSVGQEGALRVKKLAPEAVLPSRGSEHAAGYDLSSAYEAIVPARGKALVKTELSIAIPEGTYARIAPRSGLAWKHSIDVGAGVIDYDYRGPVAVILFNHSDTDFNIKEGDRIAQLILEKIAIPEVFEVDSLDSTERGAGGFGSTGIQKKAEIVAAAVVETVSAADTVD
ncbi:unnamed protein product [Calypogeia fissa]